ncbi:hypothetical protein BJV78DRAFT_1259964 [Lactifluus subvellereus]|nr:hypothetical protein BJV78DRAFT_1259964 [Lactifluus subvellereus]
MPSAKGSLTLFCQAIDHKNQPLGRIFSVSVPTSANVDDLYDKVITKSVELFPVFRASLGSLQLWKLSTPIPDNRVLPVEYLKEYEGIFIKVKAWGVFEKSDIDLNNIICATSVPDFVLEFERELDKKRGVAHNGHIEYTIPNTGTQILVHEDSTTEDRSSGDLTDEDESHGERRLAERLEVMHTAYVAFEGWETFWQGPLGPALKEHVANMIFFGCFVLNVPKGGVTTAQLNHTPWPFDLIMKRVAVPPMKEELRLYKPCSDVLVLKSTLPRLLVEVNSSQKKEWAPDLIRMLLQGAAVVRFANTFLDAFKEKKDFVLIAIFIRDDGKAIRYTLFQRQNARAVFYADKNFWLNTSVGRVKFVHQLYNLLHVSVGGEEAEDTKATIEQLKDKILKQNEESPMKSFHTKEGTQGQGTKGKGAHTGGGAGAGAGGAGAADCAELRAHGYEVNPEVIVDDKGIAWEKLFKMPSHILTVYRPSDPSKELIAKKVRKKSNELEILKLLNTIQPKSEHVISLLDSFHTQSGPWAILSKMDTVADYVALAPNQLGGRVTQVCRDLIKGLAYLHKLCIAHRDIKPDNLVVDQDFCLKIIDFDIAMQVKDEDEEVDGQCGTRHWMAPEVEDKSSTYSPIKADRWSCGRVLLYLLDEFRKEDKFLRAIAGKLKAHDPKQRPSLLEWHTWFTTPFLDMANVRKGGERKASRPQQDAMEGTKPPEAKKQRLIVSDQNEREREFPELYELQTSRPMAQVN